jgi:hypothetical protein
VLDGVHYEVQATDASEMGFDVIRERAQWAAAASAEEWVSFMSVDRRCTYNRTDANWGWRALLC